MLQPPNQTQPWPKPLIELLEHQQTLVTDLSTLAQQQATLITSGRTEQLMELLGRRQAVIDQFTATQSQLTELTSDLDARLKSVTDTQREHIKTLIAQIGDQLASVMQRDAQDQDSLRSGRDQVQQELAIMGTSRTARAAYGPTNGNPPRLADRHG
jgi:flagellar biosynthesis/type III secretory pathway chaperone